MGQRKKKQRRVGSEKGSINSGQATIAEKINLFVMSVCSAIVPLVLRIQLVTFDKTTAAAYKGETSYIDVFNHWKVQLLIFSFAIMCIVWLVHLARKSEVPSMRLFVPLGVYSFFVILSALFSPYKWVVSHGFPDRLEGVYVLLAYVLLAVSGALCARTDKARTLVIGLTMISSVVMAILGVSQYLGKDFLQTVTGKSLYIPDIYSVLADKLDFNFGKHYMYVTVYNPNYLGSYSALLLPIAVMLCFYWIEKKSFLSVLGFLFIGANFILWLGGMSRAGLVGGVAALLFLISFGTRHVLRHWKAVVLIVLMCSVIFTGMDRFSEGAVTREFRRTLPAAIEAKLPKPSAKSSFLPFLVPSFAQTTDAEGIVSETPSAEAAATSAAKRPPETAMKTTPIPTPAPTQAPASKPAPPAKPLVLSTTLENNRFRFETETEALLVVYEDGGLLIFDGANQELEYTVSEKEDADGNVISTIAFQDERYSHYAMQLVSGGALLKWWGHTIPLIVVDDQLTVNTKKGVYESHIEAPEVLNIGDNENYASNRGYIWSRSIPLLKKNLILGAGPDAYAIVFPQTDIAGKINWLSDNNMLVDKPHNWYLQVAINTGMISLLALLTFLAWFLLRGIRMKNEPSLGEGRLIHIGIMSGVVGYCVAGIANDSNVSVAPVFWVMLGLGLSYVLSAQQARTARLSEDSKTAPQSEPARKTKSVGK